jgi:hypothetical protein
LLTRVNPYGESSGIVSPLDNVTRPPETVTALHGMLTARTS